MRIVELVDSLDFGGAEQIVVSLAAALAASGHAVTVICLREIGSQSVDIGPLEAAGGEVIALNKPPGPHLPTLRKLVAALRDRRVEVVHSHNHLVHHYGVVAARLAGVHAILGTLHGSASLLGSPWWTRALFWVAGVGGHRVISVCREVNEILRNRLRFPAAKLGIVDNGIRLERLLAIEARTPGRPFTFGAIGRLESVKDHQNLLRAFALIDVGAEAVRLRVLGDGTLMAELQALAGQLGIESRVNFEGFSLDTAGFLEDIDAFVLSSRSEGLPLALLEAMAAALPVVATTVGEVPDIVGAAQCGWLCPPQDPEQLATAMTACLHSADGSLLGSRAREYVRARYSVERMAREYEALYESIAIVA